MSMVYVIAARVEGPCKIGVSAKPLTRLATLQTGSHETLRLYSAWDHGQDAETVEARCHAELSSHRISGEWFAVSVAEAENTICTRMDRGCAPEDLARACALRVKYGGEAGLEEAIEELTPLVLSREKWKKENAENAENA